MDNYGIVCNKEYMPLFDDNNNNNKDLIFDKNQLFNNLNQLCKKTKIKISKQL